MNKKEIYGMALVMTNLFLIFSLLMFIIYLIAPLMNGKLSAHALMAYASWIALALVGKFFIKRVINELTIRWYDYSLISLAAVINLLIWFSYPINLILSILCVVGAAFSYKAQKQLRG
jgi:hypothetical protein